MPTPSLSDILLSSETANSGMHQQLPPVPHPGQDRGSAPSSVASLAGGSMAEPESGVANPRAPPSQGLYQCADCKKRYSRPEHLARHIKGHTLGKRFTCSVCGKAFARADLLKRHVANHENDDGTRKRRRVSPNSSRVTRACRACAAARVKCEESKPCSRCTKRNVICEYSSPEDEAEADSDFSIPMGASSVLQGSATANGTPRSNTSDVSSSPATHLGPRSAPNLMTINDGHQFRHTEMEAHPSANEQVSGSMEPMAGGLPHGGEDMSWLPFSNFMHDLLYEQPSYDMPKIAGSQGFTALDFCDNVNYDMNDVDYRMLDQWNLDGAQDVPKTLRPGTPGTDDSALDMSQMRKRLVQMWSEPSTRWQPRNNEDGRIEQGNLPLPFGDIARQHFQERQKQKDRVVNDKLEPSSGNKILVVLLRACDGDSLRMRIASSFPTTELLDMLMQTYLASQQHNVSSWVHYGSLKVNSQWPEWMALVVAAGATLTPAMTLRKFGFAIQDSIRQTLQATFEKDFKTIFDVVLIQTITLLHDIGLWSGNRRKMEKAECHIQIPVTMMRYRGKLRRSAYPLITVDPADEDDVLEQKWARWTELESWKRLAFHCFLRDSQVSMASTVNQCVSYAELNLPLPESRDLWTARTAVEWKHRYLSRTNRQSAPLPNIHDMLQDIKNLIDNQDRVDTQFATAIYLAALWSLIFSWRQLHTAHRSSALNNNWATGPARSLTLRHQELCEALSTVQAAIAHLRTGLAPREGIILHLLQMHLYVSMEDLQLFSGKEGEEQARRVLPILQQWAQRPDSRHAVWHAGQVLRQAKMMAPGHLRDFSTIGVLQATQALWTYSLVTKTTYSSANPTPTTRFNAPAMAMHTGSTSDTTPTSMTASWGPTPSQETLVYIDEPESAEMYAFISSGSYRPALRGPETWHHTGHHHQPPQRLEACLDDFTAFMRIPIEILRANHAAADGGPDDPLPPLVENICQVIRSLGEAARVVE